MKRLLLALIGLCALFATPTLAANCSTYPYTLTNGSLADANQVMANFNSILNCANNNLIAAGANSTITALSGLTTPLSVPQGGTGVATLATDRLVLGQGSSSLTSVASGTSGQVLTSNGTSAPTFQALPSTLTAYDNSGSANASHIVSGSAGVVTTSITVNFSGAAAFSSSSSFFCTVTAKTTTKDAMSYTAPSGSSIVVYGPNSTTFAYVCIGN